MDRTVSNFIKSEGFFCTTLVVSSRPKMAWVGGFSIQAVRTSGLGFTAFSSRQGPGDGSIWAFPKTGDPKIVP